MRMRHLMVAAAVLVLGIVGAALCLDDGEVVILHTWNAEGQSFETELWIAEVNGQLYLRGAENRAWIERLREHPRVELERGGTTRAYEAHPVEDPEVKAALDAAMAEKYGGSDWLAHAVFDRRPPLPIRLDPVNP